MADTEDIPAILLQGASLFPHQLLPLHLFEPRYRRMTEDALAGDRRFAVGESIATAEGTEGAGSWATLGRIVSHQALPDGRHIVLLEGEIRLKVAGLAGKRPYPKLRAERIEDGTPGPLDHISTARTLAAVERLLAEATPAEQATTLLPRLQQLAASHPGRFADAVAGHLVGDAALRERLLGCADPTQRLKWLLAFLGRLEIERGLGPSGGGFDPKLN
jgi:Lon protease-like protein